MTIWVNKRTGETKNQYTQPLPTHEWEKKREGYSSPSPSGDDDFLLGAVTGAVLGSVFDHTPSYDPTPSFDGGGGDFGGGGGGGDW